jgi:hypothetical protein
MTYMSKEKFQAQRSRPFYEEVDPSFANVNNYSKDASRAISRGALLSSDWRILNDLKRSGNIYYWLAVESRFKGVAYEGIALKFEGVKKDKRWLFTRPGDGEEVCLGKVGVSKLVIQYNLSDKQIKNYGWLYGVPDKKVLINQLKEDQSSE